MLRWAAATSPRLAARVPLRCWPDATSPATYLGARADDEAVVQTWDTDTGTGAVVWSLPEMEPTSLGRIAPRIKATPTVVAMMMSDFGIDGPGVDAVNIADPENEYIVPWRDMARVLGRPVPYWPSTLRLPELICNWQPDDPTVTAAARADLDTGALLRLAAVFDPEHSTHRTLLNLARTVQARATSEAQQDLEMLREAINRRSGPEVPTAVAAAPMDVPLAAREDLEPMIRRAGWLDVLSRSDALSVQCVREALAWDGGKDFPFCSPREVERDIGPGAEWAARLEPIERTAAFELIDHDGGGQTFTDPATDAPAVWRTSGRLVAAIPQRLPATSPLAELILSRNLVWIRTADGTLYPAPQVPGHGLSWGYGGGGPGALAIVIDRLLDDINAPAPARHGAPNGLEELTQMKWPDGTVLTRNQLEAARDGHPPHPETTDT